MAKFTVVIDCNNDAFGDCLDFEVTRILRDIADKIESSGLSGFYETIRDVNGNDVGRFAIKNDDGTNHNK